MGDRHLKMRGKKFPIAVPLSSLAPLTLFVLAAIQ
jgi:hypothetical protein